MGQSWYDLTYRDYSNELSTMQVFITTLTAVNITAELILVGALKSATDTITNGVAAKDRVINNAQQLGAGLPSYAYAQREMKWLVRYHGVDNNKKWSLEIPTAQLTNDAAETRLLAGTDFADLANADIAAWVDAFEAVARPPDSDTSLVVVDSIQFVGRDL